MSYTIIYYNPIEDEIQASSSRYENTVSESGTSQRPGDPKLQGTQSVVYWDSPRRTLKHALKSREKGNTSKKLP